jgi:hypothetical protein
MNETVVTYISYTSHSYIYVHIKIKQNYFKKSILISCIYIIFFSYLDLFSLDNDSFDYRNVD